MESESYLILLRCGLDQEGGPQAELWCEKMLQQLNLVEDPKLMAQIARAFVDSIEFRGGTWQNADTLSLIKKPISNTVNVLIYVAIRDAKLLELRNKLETEPSPYKGHKVEFLFKICQEH